jgi:tetratricopeptide (TPR) repeat protein
VSYFLDLFDQVETKEVNKNIREHYNAIYGLACKSRELNTLGHVYLSAGKIDEAILVFYLNTYLFRYEPNVYLNYGIALEANDELEKAKENFSKALELEPEYELAKKKLAGLKEN